MFSPIRFGWRPGFTRTPLVARNASLIGVKTPLSYRFYSRNVPVKKQKTPRIRYIFAMVLLSYGCLHFVASKVEKKAPRTTFSEREFEEYEKETGLKRRSRLIPVEKNSQYAFYAVPFAHDASLVLDELKLRVLPLEREIKVIYPLELIDKEIEQKGRYSYLLEDLKSQNKSLPKGLVTALVKQEIQLFLNTTKGQYDTSIVMMNYPQTTEEAIKFENDVSGIEQCIVAQKDFDENVAKLLDTNSVRLVNNVMGYFDIVEKLKKI